MQNDTSKFRVGSKSKRGYLLFIIIIVLILAVFGARIVKKNNLPNQNNNQETTNEAELPLGSSASENQNTNENVAQATQSTVSKIQLADNVRLNVAFASQAPLLNWDALHEEACEEASMIMVYFYYHNLSLDKQVMEDQIQKNVKWQEEEGYGVSLEAQETVDILKKYYSLESSIIENPTIDDLKAQLTQDNLIIVPCAGRMLGNPNYTGEGPLYHMLVLIGYDNDEFITNDPGTRKGEGYRYEYPVLMNAIHEWNGGDVDNGDRKVIVVPKISA